MLAASEDAEASLSKLSTVIALLNTEFTQAKSAQDRLASTLQEVATAVSVGNPSQERRLAELEQRALELEEQRDQAEQERRYIAEEQDEFVAALIDEYEERLSALQAELAQHREDSPSAAHAVTTTESSPVTDGSAPPSATLHELADARELIKALQEERSQARELMRRVQTQRDEAQRALKRALGDLDRLKHGVVPDGVGDWDREATPAPPPAYEEPDASPPHDWQNPPERFGVTESHRQEVMSRATSPRLMVDAALHAQAGALDEEAADAVHTRPTTPPPAGVKSSPPPQGSSASRPPEGGSGVKRKPDPSERPLIGYSMNAGEVATEDLGSVRPRRAR